MSGILCVLRVENMCLYTCIGYTCITHVFMQYNTCVGYTHALHMQFDTCITCVKHMHYRCSTHILQLQVYEVHV